MALSILRDKASNIQKGVFYTIMADKVSDSSDQQQLVLCLWWINVDLTPQEMFIGLNVVPNICADTFVAFIWDVLICMNLTLKYCRGQCYDGTSNMSKAKSGVTTQIKAGESRAIFSHCYGHSLQLAIVDMIKKVKDLKDTLDTTFKISKLLRFSPKRGTLFKKLKKTLLLNFLASEHCIQQDALFMVVLCRALLIIGMYRKN